MIDTRGTYFTVRNRVSRHNSRAWRKGLPADLTTAQVYECIQFWNAACCFCGKEADHLEELSIDHFEPISAPDSAGNTVTNVVPSCRSCNTAKADQQPVTWLYATFSPQYARATLALIERYFDQMEQS